MHGGATRLRGASNNGGGAFPKNRRRNRRHARVPKENKTRTKNHEMNDVDWLSRNGLRITGLAKNAKARHTHTPGAL